MGRTVTGTTDAGGAATFADLEPGRSLVVEAAHAVLGFPGRKAVRLPEVGETVLEIAPPAGRTLRGRVTDALTVSECRGPAWAWGGRSFARSGRRRRSLRAPRMGAGG